MATYYDIKGQQVQNLASDPNPVVEGQVWYNTTSAALVAGGANPGIGGRKADAFSYNGSSWTTLNSVPTPLNGLDADGPISAGITAGGNTPGSPVATNTSSFDFDGTNWTSNPTLPVGRSGHAVVGGAAAQTAAIAVSGESAPTSATTTSAWDGSTWTAGAAIPSWAQGTSGGGTTSDAFVQGYVGAGNAESTKDWNGSTWTAGNDTNNAHNYGGAGGSATSGLVFGGTQTPNPGTRTAQAERYDGTSWTTDASMSEARSNAHGKATVSGGSALVATGNPGSGYTNATESYQGAGPVTQTLTTS